MFQFDFRKHTDFAKALPAALPRVDIILSYAGADGALVMAAAAAVMQTPMGFFVDRYGARGTEEILEGTPGA